jgi:hypothetical protein
MYLIYFLSVNYLSKVQVKIMATKEGIPEYCNKICQPADVPEHIPTVYIATGTN